MQYSFRVDEDAQRGQTLDDKVHISTQSEASHTGSSHNHGDSVYLQSLPVSTNDAYTIQSTDAELAAVGADSESSLEDKLRKATRRHAQNDEDGFIPIDEFNKILTRQSVWRELQSNLAKLSKEKDLDSWVSAIWDMVESEPKTHTSRRKIFAVLVLLNAPEKIGLFIDEDLWDKDLPFIREADNKSKWLTSQGQGEARIVECLSNPNGWKGHVLDLFNLYQWRMLSPFFNMVDGRVEFQRFHRLIPLPFEEDEKYNEEDLSGGSADVRRVLIHRSHYNLSNSTKDPVSSSIIELISYTILPY